jgi:hypothetical protein
MERGAEGAAGFRGVAAGVDGFVDMGLELFVDFAREAGLSEEVGQTR